MSNIVLFPRPTGLQPSPAAQQLIDNLHKLNLAIDLLIAMMPRISTEHPEFVANITEPLDELKIARDRAGDLGRGLSSTHKASAQQQPRMTPSYLRLNDTRLGDCS